jgi:redox-sensitive bicupin YhaK (pirin superfamily)
LGTEQLITPGQVNLMTAGEGVSHSEEATGQYEGSLQGIQLWIAQPASTRHSPAAFEHHDGPPRLESSGSLSSVLIGEFCGVTSAARHDTPLVGVEVHSWGSTTFPLRPDFEYAFILLEGAVSIDGELLVPGNLGYLGIGNDEISIDTVDPSRLMVLGGVPFESEIVMWWNFVARSREEIDAAYDAWQDNDGRYGSVASALDRIMTPAPFWRHGT